MKKIALLFLTIDNHNQPKIWEQFLKNKSYFNIYCHPKYPNKVTDSFLKSNILQTTAKTSWGYLVLAYYELLKEAYKNKDNYKFVYISEGCIPIKSADYVYKILTQDNATYVDTNIRMSKYDIEFRFNKHKETYNKYGINKYNFVKHTGWFVLNRPHSELLLKNERIFKYFNNVIAGDENFLSILKANQMKLTPRVTTCVTWDTNIYKNYKEISGKLWKMYDIEKDEYKKKHIEKLIKTKKEEMLELTKHPKTYTKITSSDLKYFNKTQCLFVRKVLPTSDLSILYPKK